MNQKKFVLIFSAIILSVALAAVFIAWQNKIPATVKSPVPVVGGVTSTESEWRLYENVKYGYRFMYPPEGNVHDDGGMTDVKESSDLVAFIPGEGTLIEVLAQIPCMALPQSKGGCGGVLILPLHSFAETVRRYQVEDTNPNFKDKEVGNLKQLTFKGKAAYQFTLTRSFSDGPSGGGYSFSGGMHNYILFEHNNAKFILHYPLGNKLSQKLSDSFEFVNN